MDLIDASSYFDQDIVRDGYTNQMLFWGHTLPHDDHTSSGATVRRRTLVTEPGTQAPLRRVIQVNDEYWLVGNNNPDSFQGEIVRRNYGLKKSSGLASLLSPAEACLAAPGLKLHIQREYFRDVTDTQTSSEWDVMWNVFIPFNEPAAKGMFLRLGTSIMRIRNLYQSVDEFQVAEADELDVDAFQSLEFIKKSKPNLVTGKQETESIRVTGIQIDFPKSYSFRLESEAKGEPGDRAVIVAKQSITPGVGGVFTMQGANWRVLSTVSSGDSWMLHVRRA
jgi:hypothetical protein